MERIDDLNLGGKRIIQDTELFLFGMDSVLLANIVKKTNKDANRMEEMYINMLLEEQKNRYEYSKNVLPK